MITCPSAPTLAVLAADSLDGAVFGAIENHIATCDHCLAEIERLRRNDATGAGPALPGPGEPPRIPGFVVECELGRGGMSVVYQARQPSLRRRVALKVVRSGPASGSRDHARWLREARWFAGVAHENVVRLFHVGEADGWLYMVLELVRGGTLKDRLETPYSSKDAAALLLTITQAVAAIHRAGLVHLDLKPSNILLDGEPGAPRELAAPRVADFSIAHRWDDAEASWTTASMAGPLGTPSYMAPEQAVGDREAIGPVTDIHGLGAVLYHVLTCRPPFAAPSVAETLDQVRGQAPAPPRRLNHTIHRDLDTICLKCLQKDPARRYASAEALADDLRRFLAGQPITGRGVSKPERAWRWCRRRPAIASLIAALALTWLGGCVGLFVLWRSSETARARAELARAREGAERGRAEQAYEVSRAALAEVLNIGQTGTRSPVTLTRNELIVALSRARSYLSELARRRPADHSVWTMLATADTALGRNLDLEGKLAEALPLHDEALALWERILQSSPGDRAALLNRGRALICVARVLQQMGRVSESLACWERAISESEATFSLEHDYNSMIACRVEVARLIHPLGNHWRAHELLESGLCMLTAASQSTSTPEIHELILATRTEIQGLDLCPQAASPRRLVHAQGADSVPAFLISTCDYLSGEERARRVVAQCYSDPVSSAVGAQELARSIESTVNLVAETASCQRRAGNLKEARRIVDRLHALGSDLVTARPSDPAAHLALSEAFRQHAKDAWGVRDFVGMDQNWNRALHETRQAVLLDPQNPRARDRAADLERRLEALAVSSRTRGNTGGALVTGPGGRPG
jgi:eukaryotic-like serine/threonine-protein kinase